MGIVTEGGFSNPCEVGSSHVELWLSYLPVVVFHLRLRGCVVYHSGIYLKDTTDKIASRIVVSLLHLSRRVVTR